MPVEIIGWIAPRVSSELIPPSGPPFDAGVVAETARIHERAGLDRVLIGYFSEAPDGFLIGAHAASVTERLGFLLAHRPGFVAPPLAARKLATLDQLSGGRLAVHIIAGGSDADQAKDGDWTDHAARYRRADEYIGLLRRTWTASSRSTMTANSTGPVRRIPKSAAISCRIFRFTAAAVRTRRSGPWPRMSMCTCCTYIVCNAAGQSPSGTSSATRSTPVVLAFDDDLTIRG